MSIEQERAWMGVMSSLACGYGAGGKEERGQAVQLLDVYESEAKDAIEAAMRNPIGDDRRWHAQLRMHHKLAAEEQRRRLAIYQHVEVGS